MFEPKYTLSSSILTMLMSIAESRVVIDRAKLLPKNEVRLRRQAIIRMTQSSTEIEGNRLSLQQVEALYANKQIDAPERDIYEVKNYLKALKYIETVVQAGRPITEKIFLKIHGLVTHKTLPKEQAGQYRQGPVYIVRRRFGMPNEVMYTGPSAQEVSSLCQDFFAWLAGSESQGLNPVLVAGIAHQEIAAIHPFADGNGRTARAMAALILYARSYDFRRLFALEDFYNKDRPSYYRAINIGESYHRRRVDFTPWLEYFVRGFKEEIDSVKSQILTLSLRKTSAADGSKIFLEKEQLVLLDYIGQMGKITVTDVIDILSCPRRTAQSKLFKLKSLGIIRQNGKGPATAYILR